MTKKNKKKPSKRGRLKEIPPLFFRDCDTEKLCEKVDNEYGCSYKTTKSISPIVQCHQTFRGIGKIAI